MASICTPCSIPGEGTAHPVRGQLWGHPTGSYPRLGAFWGVTEPPRPGIPGGDTSPPARMSRGGSQGWVPARDKPLDPSSRHQAGLRCTRSCHLIAGDQRPFVILGMAGEV